jgi:hypothetical protein
MATNQSKSDVLPFADRHRAALLAAEALDPMRSGDAYEAIPFLMRDVRERLGDAAVAEFAFAFIDGLRAELKLPIRTSK